MTRWLFRHFGFCIDNWGLWFRYKGDEVCWLWRWKRKYNHIVRAGKVVGNGVWYSLCLDSAFVSLQEIDEFWEELFLASERSNDGQ
jgi:hypothetical protein